jgi:hypothetical protein
VSNVTPSVADVCTGQTPPPSPAPTASSQRPRTGAMKTPIHGLIDLGQVIADDMPEPPSNTLYYVCRRQTAMSGIVVNDTWEHMQPTDGATIDMSSIDAALTAIAAYNGKPGRHLGVRLRIWAGIDAPLWAKKIGGPPIQICEQNAVPCPSTSIRTVGRFWANAYETAWRTFVSELAKAYDADSRVSEFSLSSCSSLTAEPFVQPEDPYSRAHLIAAHYSDAKYRACLLNAVKNDYVPYWHQTPVDFSFNPFREIDARPATDLAFTKAAIDECRTVAGSRCILLNETMAKFTPPPAPNPSQTPSIARSYYEMWNYMQRQGGSITFQTSAPVKLLAAWQTNRGGWNAAVRLAGHFGASSLELFAPKYGDPCYDEPSQPWTGGYTCFSPSVLAGWSGELH